MVPDLAFRSQSRPALVHSGHMTHQGAFEVGFCMRPSTGFRSAWFSSWTMMLIQKTDAVTLSSGRNIFAGPSSPQERELSVLTTCVMHLRNNRLGSTHLSNELSKTLMQSLESFTEPFFGSSCLWKTRQPDWEREWRALM